MSRIQLHSQHLNQSEFRSIFILYQCICVCCNLGTLLWLCRQIWDRLTYLTKTDSTWFCYRQFFSTKILLYEFIICFVCRYKTLIIQDFSNIESFQNLLHSSLKATGIFKMKVLYPSENKWFCRRFPYLSSHDQSSSTCYLYLHNLFQWHEE